MNYYIYFYYQTIGIAAKPKFVAPTEAAKPANNGPSRVRTLGQDSGYSPSAGAKWGGDDDLIDVDDDEDD